MRVALLRIHFLTFLARVALLLAVATASPGGKKRKDGENATMTRMPHHSFVPPLNYEALLDDWVVSGASIFEKERLLVHPAVSQRLGFLWSKRPVMTGNFEIIVHFKVAGDNNVKPTSTDQSLAVWYVEENVASNYKEADFIKAESWKKAMDDAGMTFAGAKAKFKGFGAVLSFVDTSKASKPAVSFVSNDGTKTLEFGKDAPTATAKNIDFRNTMNFAQLRIRVSPESIEGSLKQSPSLSWNECFKISKTAGSSWAETNGFVGVSAWSGSDGPSDMVSIMQVEMNNYDDTVIGEEMQDVSAKIQDAYREMLTDEKRHFVDQKSQMEHLNRLTSMLSDHVKEARPADQKLFEDLRSLEKRMGRLDEDCRTLSKEFEVLVNPAGGAGAGAVKDEIIGLRRLLIKDGHTHRETADRIKKNVNEVKDKNSKAKNPETLGVISAQSESLEKTVNARSSQMSVMLFVLIGCVILIGGLMWNRMNYYEKKHFI